MSRRVRLPRYLKDTIEEAIDFVENFNGDGRARCAKDAIDTAIIEKKFCSSYDKWEKEFKD